MAFVYATVLEGAVRCQLNDGPATVNRWPQIPCEIHDPIWSRVGQELGSCRQHRAMGVGKSNVLVGLILILAVWSFCRRGVSRVTQVRRECDLKPESLAGPYPAAQAAVIAAAIDSGRQAAAAVRLLRTDRKTIDLDVRSGS